MESLLISLEIVLPLFLLMALGYVIKLTGMMNETSVKQVNKVIFKIFLPLLVFCNIYNTELAESFNSQLLLYAVAGVLIQFVLSLCLAILLEKDNSRRGVMLQGMFRSNFVLFGIPISTALFGDTAAGLASILIAVIIPMYNVLAVISLEMFNGKRPNVGKILLGIVTNPLIIGSVLGVLFVLFQIPIPTPIYDTITDISSIATPLAFIILGASFSFGDVGKYIKEVLLVLGAKLLVFPALFLGIAPVSYTHLTVPVPEMWMSRTRTSTTPKSTMNGKKTAIATRILSRNVSAITSTSKTQPPAIRNCLLRWNPPV